MEASRKRGRRALALSLLCVSAAVAPPPPLPPPPPPPAPQVWSGATNALPDPRLPHLPMLGNGAIGVLLDARDDTHANAAGGGGDNALDLYVGSGSLWSCGACASPAAGCCRLVALGGVSVSLRPTFGTAPPDAASVLHSTTLRGGWTPSAPYQMDSPKAVGGLAGIDIEVMTEMARRVGLDVHLDRETWEMQLARLASGEADIALGAVVPAGEENRFLVSVPYRQMRTAFYTRKGDDERYAPEDVPAEVAAE